MWPRVEVKSPYRYKFLPINGYQSMHAHPVTSRISSSTVLPCSLFSPLRPPWPPRGSVNMPIIDPSQVLPWLSFLLQPSTLDFYPFIVASPSPLHLFSHANLSVTSFLAALFFKKPSFYVFIFLFLAAPRCMWDLNSQTRDWIHAPCSGSAES